MKRIRAAATPPWLSSVPPDSNDDEAPAPRSSTEQDSPKPGPRLVASIVDPGVVDPFVLSGPGAPAPGFTGPTDEHPVKARLLARSRKGGSPIPEDKTEPWLTEPWLTEAEAQPTPPSAPTASAALSSLPAAESTSVPPTPFVGTPAAPPAEVAAELERIAGHHTLPPALSSKLSPNLTALLGALLGLTVMGTLGVVLGRVHQGLPIPATETGLPTPEAKPAEPTEPVRVDRKRVAAPWRVDDDKGAAGMRVIRGTVGKLPFLKAIQDAGVPKSEAYRAYAALKDVKNLDRCASSDQFRALVEQGSKKLKAFEFISGPEEIYQAKTGPDGLLRGEKLDLKVERNQVRRALAYDGKSFEESARAAGFDTGLSSVVEKALAGHMMLAEMRGGDRLRIIVQEVTVLGEFSRYAGVEAIELLREGKPTQRFYYYSHPEQGGYFDASGKAPFEGGWRKPIPTAPVTSHFNMKRMHPVLHKIMPHNGTDFGAPSGTPIGATAPGTVTFIGPAGPSGNLVKLKHAGGYESGYAHLSRYVPSLHLGDPVERMQIIGYCGTTGRSTGPHLHFTMRKDGVYIDAESLNLDGMRVLPPSHRAEFAEVRSKYDPILEAIVLPPALATASAAPAATGPAGGNEDTDPSEAEESDEDDPLRDAAEARPAPAAPAATPPPPAAAHVAAPAQTKPGNSIFLSDADLLKMQSAKDDGEVNE